MHISPLKHRIFCGIFRAFHYLAIVFLHHPLTANKLEEKNAYFSALTYLHASFTLAVVLLRNQLAKFVLDNLLFIYLNANKLPSPKPKARKKPIFNHILNHALRILAK